MSDDHLAKALRWGPVPVDKVWDGAENLDKILMDTASYHAHRALDDFTKESNAEAVAALHAGIAVEHLAKCYLATVSPVLIAARNCDFDTLLHLSGKSSLAKSQPHTMQTVGGDEACKRVQRLLPGLRLTDSVTLIFIVRNSVSHLGVRYDVRQVIRSMVRVADYLLEAVDCDREWFWGNKLNIVDALRDENISEQLAILSVKFEAARRYLERSLRNLTPAEQEMYKTIATARNQFHGVDYAQPYTCPVCGSQGALLCHREYEFIDAEAIEDSYRIFTEAVAYPFEFSCGVCDLSLDQGDMEAAGMPAEVELPESEVGKRAKP